MFKHLSPAAVDPILSVAEAFRHDSRAHKLDLSVGVYRDAQGNTPIMAAVKAAEQQLWQEESTKTYVGLGGNLRFLEAVKRLALPANIAAERWTAMQTVGGSGALRLVADLIANANPQATVWLSDPSYANHAPIMRAAGLKVASYPYLDLATGGLRRAAMFDTLAKLGADDVLLLHGCCHNPSGTDLELSDWQQVADMAVAQGFLPMVDIAYQGLGEGIAEDVAGVGLLAQAVEQMLLVYSCSKHFGLYRERTGAALVLSANADSATKVKGKLFELARRSYTMAADHGAELVARIMASPALEQQWRDELNGMRERVIRIRHGLADAMAAQGADGERLRLHRGMFSILPLDEAQIARLREESAIYAVGGGRINLAGLDEKRIPELATALATVMRKG